MAINALSLVLDLVLSKRILFHKSVIEHPFTGVEVHMKPLITKSANVLSFHLKRNEVLFHSSALQSDMQKCK